MPLPLQIPSGLLDHMVQVVEDTAQHPGSAEESYAAISSTQN